jgi:hypothetical protein
MRNTKHEAECLRAGLVGGWRTAAEIIAWADDVLASDPESPREVVEIALASRQPRETLAALLRSIPGGVDRVAVMRECLSDLRRWMGNDIDRGAQVAHYLYALAGSDLLPVSEFGSEPYGLDDNFSLARAGSYGTLLDAMAHLQKWLDAHSQ